MASGTLRQALPKIRIQPPRSTGRRDDVRLGNTLEEVEQGRQARVERAHQDFVDRKHGAGDGHEAGRLAHRLEGTLEDVPARQHLGAENGAASGSSEETSEPGAVARSVAVRGTGATAGGRGAG